MDEMQAQYEAYPYPERDPKDEAKRLITGSPSWPVEMDHWIWGGSRDWSTPLRALVAGGGTGDGLIQLATVLAGAGRPYEITYLDLSRAARRIAEDRAAARRLPPIGFHTDTLLNAAAYGPFDYIDCCGVLHHLPDPQAGFDALAGALAPGGGIGLMVYAPYGRSGVYPVQDAFRTLTRGRAPEARLAVAKSVFANLPEGHPFKRNPHLVDHKASDAGFYDLLLHASDRPFRISSLIEALDTAGLELAGLPEPVMYDPSDLAPDLPKDLSAAERMQLAEDLRGTLKVHVAYAVRAGTRRKPPLGQPKARPHLRNLPADKLAKIIAQKGEISITTGGVKSRVTLPKAAAPLIRAIDGRRDLSALRQMAHLDPIRFNAVWAPVERALTERGLLHYSTLLAR